MPPSPEPDFSVQSDDAVCFTAGLHGVSFGAGAIHAYLASDRKPPKIAAGISTGALTAAAMERSYKELSGSRTEAARWTWFRRYLATLLDRPYDVAWHAIPNPSDFVADLPPVAETVLPTLPDGSADPVWELREARARRRQHIIARFGRWCSHLPVTVSSAAWIAVRYARHREGYFPTRIARWWNAAALWTRVLRLEWTVLMQIVARPQFFPEWRFRAAGKPVSNSFVRPLFGWKLWSATVILSCATIAAWIWNLWIAVEEIAGERPAHVLFHFTLLVLFTGAPLIPIFLRSWMHGSNNWGFKKILTHLGIRASLLDDFHLRLKLHRLFAEGGAEPAMKDLQFPVLMVAAPLQMIDDAPTQLWPLIGSSVPVVEALRASLAIPRLFAPSVVEGGALKDWLAQGKSAARLDLVDGSVVRHNPLPALVRFLAEDTNAALREALSQPEARVHLVYDIPIHAKPAGEAGERMPNVVDTGFAGKRLERRRDSRLEVVRTNHVTQIERALEEATGAVSSPEVATITVDEIAPAGELRLDNTLQPTEVEILTHVAEGCRRTLAVLYGAELNGSEECGALLRRVASQREWSAAPGVPEVCAHCTRRIEAIAPAEDRLLPDTFRAGTGELARRFPELTGDRPRVVFLASGGVFRGSFHVGMIGAMYATGLKPDLIVGASVGTLLGAALGSMYSSTPQQAAAKRRRLTSLFLEVDRRVALTKTLKSALRDLGIRGRGASMDLSPNALRKMVRAGSRGDAGTAITGAPPALIDAISDFFLLPYRATARIAAEFAAGRVTRAINSFWTQIKTETIDRLGIYDALIGSSLLERETRQVLGDVPQNAQPFLEPSRIAFFATAVNLATEWIAILGAEPEGSRYDLIEALLASSAFPMAFAPRRASALYPGAGHREVLYGDGGMFDNLPFLPAFEILREVQLDHWQPGRWREDLVQRYRAPDLFLTGALNCRQTNDEEGYDSLRKIAARATSLEDNEKIYGMERTCRQIDRQLSRVGAQLSASAPSPETERFLAGIVNAAVLPVFPADAEHLNGTYEFCGTMGMDVAKIRRSIADGCFQTMLGVARGQESGPDSMVGRSLGALTAIGRVPRITFEHGRVETSGACPFFRVNGKTVACPFHGHDGIYEVCGGDRAHTGALS